jgi:Ca-activated chloride channel family protein
MQQKDFEGKTRLEAAQSVARQFIGQRSGDRVGLVVFSGKSFTQCPLTIDHQVLGMLLDNISSSSIKESGTAIGTAILTATNRLRASESRDKALVLLTDGENNAGEIAPVTAAQLAVQNGVRIYTIFAGRTEGGTVSVEASVSAGDSLSTVAVGRDDLEEIARISGGNSFSAGDFAGLRQTFRDIDRMEKSRLQSRVSARKAELFPWLLLPAFWLLVAEMALTNIRMIRIP